jgi:hypothetical protein
MKFLYYLACIGNPDLDDKMRILINNLRYIYDDIKCPFDICVNCYETDETVYNHIFDKLRSLGFIENCYMHVKRGVLTEVFLTNEYNKLVDNYDYIMFIMDDVKIMDMNLLEMIRIKKLLNISVISPQIIGATYLYMYNNTGITINNFLEIYLVLLSPADFKQFIGLYTIENRWMWGIDLLFGYYNIKAGIVYKFSAMHMLPSKSNKNEGQQGLDIYFSSYTPFKNQSDILQKYSVFLLHYDDNINLKYYLLHCQEHTERIKHINTVVARLNQPVEVFNGIYTGNMDLTRQLELLHKYDTNLQISDIQLGSMSRFEFYMQGQVGCYLSHHMIIKQIMDNKLANHYIGDYSIIFEDDIQFQYNFDLDGAIKNIITDLKEMNKEFDIVYLGSLNNNYGEHVTKNIYYLDPTRPCFGAHALLINNANIEKIYQSNCNIKFAMDNQYYVNILENVLNGFVIYPSICFQSAELKSNIETDTKIVYGTIQI